MLCGRRAASLCGLFIWVLVSLVLAGCATNRMIDSVRTLVEIESPSDNPDACRRCMVTASELSQSWLGSPGAIHEYNLQPLHIWGSRTPQVLILGHLDTVWPIGTLQRIPWSCDGEVMRGPGVFDMKVGVVQAWAALHLAPLEQPQRFRNG
jgi:glutamate carboxypeptidase